MLVTHVAAIHRFDGITRYLITRADRVHISHEHELIIPSNLFNLSKNQHGKVTTKNHATNVSMSNEDTSTFSQRTNRSVP